MSLINGTTTPAPDSLPALADVAVPNLIVTLLAAGNTRRAEIILKNAGAVPVRISSDNLMVDDTGAWLDAGATVRIKTTAAIYARHPSSSNPASGTIITVAESLY